jgi:hypothetical protein
MYTYINIYVCIYIYIYSLGNLCRDLLGWGKVDMKTVFARGKLRKDGTEGPAQTLNPNS